MYRILTKQIVMLIILVVLAFGNFMLIGSSEKLWLNIMTAVGFAFCALGAVFQYKCVMRFAELMDAEKHVDDLISSHLVSDALSRHKGCPRMKEERKEDEEDDEHSYCADFK